MNKDNTTKTAKGEHSIQASLDSIAAMATRMGHPSSTMEIIGIASPEDAEKLQQGNDNNVLILPDKHP